MHEGAKCTLIMNQANETETWAFHEFWVYCANLLCVCEKEETTGEDVCGSKTLKMGIQKIIPQTKTHTHTNLWLYTNLYTTVHIKSMYLCVYICMYECMYVCMYNNAWKFEQVLSKETLVSVFVFFFFLKVPSMLFSLRERTTSEVYGLR